MPAVRFVGLGAFLDAVLQKVESDLRGRAVGDVARIGLPAVIVLGLVVDASGRQAEPRVDGPEQGRIALANREGGGLAVAIILPL